MNKMTGVSINNWINSQCGKEASLELSDVIQADTDSVTGDSIIYVNGIKLTIEEYWDKFHHNVTDDKQIIPISGDKTLSFNTLNNKIEEKNINYVMRHKTNKNMYRIKYMGNEITVTEDHSIIIKREGKYLDIKPKDIIPGDTIIIKEPNSMNYYETSDFTIECIGEIETYVYDLEVEENHNFFANDILVHNSNYVTLDRLIPASTPTEKALPVVQKLVTEHIEPNIKENIKKYCELFNVRDDTVLNAENEVISKGFVSVASKRYYTRVLIKDGAELKKPKIKITGISLKGKSTPELAKEKLEPILDIILDKDIGELKQYIEDTKQAFMDAGVSEISRNVKVNSLDYKKDGAKFKRWDGIKFLTAPINSHASLVYNEFVKEKNIDKQYNYIVPSDTINYIYLNQPNNFGSKVIAFKDPKFTEFIDNKYVDRGTHFEKDFKDKVRIITNAISWDIDSKTEAIDDW